jgi:hypothetical protein
LLDVHDLVLSFKIVKFKFKFEFFYFLPFPFAAGFAFFAAGAEAAPLDPRFGGRPRPFFAPLAGAAAGAAFFAGEATGAGAAAGAALFSFFAGDAAAAAGATATAPFAGRPRPFFGASDMLELLGFDNDFDEKNRESRILL